MTANSDTDALTTSGAPLVYAAAFEQVGAAVKGMTTEEREALLEIASDPAVLKDARCTDAETDNLGTRRAFCELLRIALTAAENGDDPVDAIHERVESVRQSRGE
jgi:hypothetical protein